MYMEFAICRYSHLQMLQWIRIPVRATVRYAANRSWKSLHGACHNRTNAHTSLPENSKDSGNFLSARRFRQYSAVSVLKIVRVEVRGCREDGFGCRLRSWNRSGKIRYARS